MQKANSTLDQSVYFLYNTYLGNELNAFQRRVDCKQFERLGAFYMGMICVKVIQSPVYEARRVPAKVGDGTLNQIGKGYLQDLIVVFPEAPR
jgi:hypothetical protein